MSSAWEVTRNLGMACKQWERRTEKGGGGGAVNMETSGKDNQEEISSARVARGFIILIYNILCGAAMEIPPDALRL